MTTRDVLLAADQLIDELCADNGRLREQCAALEEIAVDLGRKASGFELVALAAVRLLGDQRRAHERLQAQHARLIEEFRQFRAKAFDGWTRQPERAA